MSDATSTVCGVADLAQILADAVAVSVDHVEAGGLPFVGVLVDRAGRASAPGFNLVRQTGDPTAHAEIVAMRRVLTDGGPASLRGQRLLATGEPCQLCYRFAADHGVTSVHYAVSSATAADWGFDYRQRFSGSDPLPLARNAHLLEVLRALEPFRRYRARTNH